MDRRRRLEAMLFGIFFWPGAGHVYVGRWRHGIAWFLGWWIPVLLMPLWFSFLWIALAVKFLHVVDLGFVPLGEPPARRGWVLLGGFGLSIVIALMLRWTVVEAYKIPSSAMLPTFEIGDHVFVEKWNRDEVARGEIIVFDNPCTPSKAFIKRVIGLPGDTVEVRCTVLYVNGAAVPRELVDDDDAYQDQDEVAGGWTSEPASRWRERLDDARYEIFQPIDVAREPDAHDFPADRAPGCGRMGGSDEPAGAIVSTADDVGGCDPHRYFEVPRGTVFVMGDNRMNSADSRVWGPVPTALITGRVIGIWWSSGKDGVRWDRIGTSF